MKVELNLKIKIRKKLNFILYIMICESPVLHKALARPLKIHPGLLREAQCHRLWSHVMSNSKNPEFFLLNWNKEVFGCDEQLCKDRTNSSGNLLSGNIKSRSRGRGRHCCCWRWIGKCSPCAQICCCAEWENQVKIWYWQVGNIFFH